METTYTQLSNAQVSSLTEHLEQLHLQILERFPGTVRIACALYDSKTDLLKTFINSTRSGQAINAYEYPLSESQSLRELKEANSCRVLSDIKTSIPNGTDHSNWLLEQDYRSSFTIPMTNGAHFIGFIFIDADESDYFTETVQRDLLLFANMIIMTISIEINAVNSLLATAQAARDFAHLRDFETGMHLTRMALLARLIARRVQQRFDLGDEIIEHIYLFSPLHDIGKIGIPDRILLKPGRLDKDEYELMREHVIKGETIIRKVLADYQLSYLADSKVMLNIVAYHHEFMDGSGYPRGLKGNEIPVEARITTVADIFDALTSQRPYKTPWTIEDALTELQQMATDGKLDPDCVQALVDEKEQAAYIIHHYLDED